MPSISGGATAPYQSAHDDDRDVNNVRQLQDLSHSDSHSLRHERRRERRDANGGDVNDDEDYLTNDIRGFQFDPDDDNIEERSCAPGVLWLNEEDCDGPILLTSLLCENDRVSTNESIKIEQQAGGGDSPHEGESVEEREKDDEEKKSKTPWSEGPFAKILGRMGAQKLGRAINQSTRTKFKATHSRGSAMRAPANNFWITRRNEKALAMLMHIAKKGVGWYRTHVRPETVEEVLNEANESDLTGDVLGKLK